MGYIYYCKNLTNNKGYVGQTTRSLEERKREHLRHLDSENVIFHAAIKKYGKENFEWSILGEYMNEDLDRYEEYWIKEKNTHYQDGHGYNMNYGGAINSGSEANSKKVRAVYLPTGKEYFFKSIHDAARQLDIHFTHISKICLGQKGYYSAKNYTFNFIDNLGNNIPTNFKGDTSLKSKGIKIIAIDTINNKTYYFSSLREAMREIKIDRHTIAKRVEDGKMFKGFIFKKEELNGKIAT